MTPIYRLALVLRGFPYEADFTEDGLKLFLDADDLREAELTSKLIGEEIGTFVLKDECDNEDMLNLIRTLLDRKLINKMALMIDKLTYRVAFVLHLFAGN